MHSRLEAAAVYLHSCSLIVRPISPRHTRNEKTRQQWRWPDVVILTRPVSVFNAFMVHTISLCPSVLGFLAFRPSAAGTASATGTAAGSSGAVDEPAAEPAPSAPADVCVGCVNRRLPGDAVCVAVVAAASSSDAVGVDTPAAEPTRSAPADVGVGCVNQRSRGGGVGVATGAAASSSDAVGVAMVAAASLIAGCRGKAALPDSCSGEAGVEPGGVGSNAAQGSVTVSQRSTHAAIEELE